MLPENHKMHKKSWIFEECFIAITIYEMNLNNPLYDAFLIEGKILN